MNPQILTAIARKDLLEVRQNKAAWMPMIIVPLIFVIIMPLAFILFPAQMDISPQALGSDPDLQTFLQNMPPAISAQLAGLNEIQQILLLVLGYLFAPMFLIMPLMFAAVIAAESFAGERERKTLEALLYTPASDAELFLGKVLAGFIPAVLISWLSFVVYALVLNGAGYSIFGRMWFPLPAWYPLIFWIAPALSLMSIALTVLISARTQTFMGAYQASGALVLLPLALVFGQLSGVLYLSAGAGLAIGALFWLIAAALTRAALSGFKRSRLLVQTAN